VDILAAKWAEMAVEWEIMTNRQEGGIMNNKDNHTCHKIQDKMMDFGTVKKV